MNKATFSVGLYTENKKPYFSHRKFGSLGSGSVVAKVFMDDDQSGTFSEGDSPMEGVRFKGRSSWRSQETDGEGEVLLTGISSSGSVLQLDTLTLDDPYLQPNVPVIRVISHAGGLQYIEVPVVQTIEIEGNVYLRKGDKKKGVGGVPVGLFQNGKLVFETKTEFDGYYFINRMIPGEYTVNVIDETGGMSKYQWSPSDEFVTDVETGVTIVPDIVLKKAN